MSEKDFEAILDKNHRDWELRSVYADYLEDVGKLKLALAQRWMSQKRKAPFYDGDIEEYEFCKPYHWTWAQTEIYNGIGIRPHYLVGLDIFNLLPAFGKGYGSGSSSEEKNALYRSFISRKDAEQSLAEALWEFPSTSRR